MEEDKHIFYTSRWKKIQKNFETFRQDVHKFQKSRLSKPKDTQTPPPVPTNQPGKPEKPQKVKKEPKKKISKQKGEKILALSLLSAVAVIMGFGIYVSYKGPLRKSREKPTLSQNTIVSPTQVPIIPSPSPTPDPYPKATVSYENVNWILYADQSLGYMIKHPETTTPKDLSDDTNLSFISFKDNVNENETFFSVMVRETTLQEEVDYIKWESSHSLVKLENEEDITFQNFPAKRLDYVPSKHEEPKPTTSFVINKNNYSYTISSKTDDIDQILSTFVFTDNTNNRYGCELDSDCIKYEACSEECVNREWLDNNSPEIAPGAACEIPWKYGCVCINNSCEQGGQQ